MLQAKLLSRASDSTQNQPNSLRKSAKKIAILTGSGGTVLLGCSAYLFATKIFAGAVMTGGGSILLFTAYCLNRNFSQNSAQSQENGSSAEQTLAIVTESIGTNHFQADATTKSQIEDLEGQIQILTEKLIEQTKSNLEDVEKQKAEITNLENCLIESNKNVEILRELVKVKDVANERIATEKQKKSISMSGPVTPSGINTLSYSSSVSSNTSTINSPEMRNIKEVAKQLLAKTVGQYSMESIPTPNFTEV
jgi:hypothetical protein